MGDVQVHARSDRCQPASGGHVLAQRIWLQRPCGRVLGSITLNLASSFYLMRGATSVFNQNTTTPSQDIGCAIIHDTATDQDEVITFWNATQGLQSKGRVYFNTMFCNALGAKKTVNVTTTGPGRASSKRRLTARASNVHVHMNGPTR